MWCWCVIIYHRLSLKYCFHILLFLVNAGNWCCSEWHCCWINFTPTSAADASYTSWLWLICRTTSSCWQWWWPVNTASTRLDDSRKCITLHEICWCKLWLAIFPVQQFSVWAMQALLQQQVREFVVKIDAIFCFLKSRQLCCAVCVLSTCINLSV